MTKSKFVYVTYISATPEQVWKALLEPEFTRQYWDCENLSDWQPGSPWEHRRPDRAGTLRLAGRVVEIAPPHRLVLTWALPADAADLAKHSRVTFEIAPIDEMVRLTVTHDELEAGSEMLQGITHGWPRVLSSLKTLLETGRPLRTWATNS
ncbi:MAG: SRPBCC family protein [Candidatus Binataceae bacterium]|nr:SRPBCC family protein [Candidatus Binataceae bacterium]